MRPIDADEFREEMIGVGYDWESVLDMMPTVDAVPVVRCKECKHFVDEGFYCAQNILPMFDHFYCYYGERSE